VTPMDKQTNIKALSKLVWY